jgi:diguanylate cyclase (GGDEF)-like protein/PAS domain S-box-containing protein
VKIAPLPENEVARLQVLRELAILDTPPEPAFDDLAALAAYVCKRPMALVSLVDANRQWFKSRRGFDVVETSRDVAFCAHAILTPAEVMVVPDAQRDERFADNPLVTSAPNVRFYAGAPLVTDSGEALGTLCVLDREPGEMTEAEIDALRTLARHAMNQLESRRSDITLLRLELEKARNQLKAQDAMLLRQEEMEKALSEKDSFREAVIERAAEGICVCHALLIHPFVQFTVWNRRMAEITGYSMDEINRLGWYQSLYPDLDYQRKAIERMERMRNGEDLRYERWEITRADGRKRALGISTSRLTSADGLEHVLALMHDFTEEENLQREATLGRKDTLTGVRNLRAFREEAAMLFSLASRTRAPSALGFLDLDDFKVINDTVGHAEGDRVLERVGATLAQSTRSTDVIGRLGGDEFVILLPNTGPAGTKVFFDRLHKRLLDVMRENTWSVGLSVGVAIFPSAPPSESDALRLADSLMYRAKKSGKNRVVYAEFPGTVDNVEQRSSTDVHEEHS